MSHPQVANREGAGAYTAQRCAPRRCASAWVGPSWRNRRHVTSASSRLQTCRGAESEDRGAAIVHGSLTCGELLRRRPLEPQRRTARATLWRSRRAFVWACDNRACMPACYAQVPNCAAVVCTSSVTTRERRKQHACGAQPKHPRIPALHKARCLPFACVHRLACCSLRRSCCLCPSSAGSRTLLPECYLDWKTNAKCTSATD